jgi:predicted permease
VRRVLEELASIPGVESVGSTQASFGAAENMQTSFEIDGRPAREGESSLSRIRHVTPGYFRALRVAMRAGRTFGEADRIGAPAVAIVSESFARQYWPGENAVGKRLRRAGSVVLWMEVVGVAADVRDVGVADPPAPTLYVPYLQQNTPTARVTVLVKTRVPPMRVADAAERAVWKVDPGQVIDFEMPLETLLGRTVVVQRLQSVLLGVFGVGGLGVVLVGLYGLVSFSVVRRSREIALRSALGAGRGAVLGLVVDDVLRPVLIGLVIGLALSIGLALYVRGAVPELTLADPAVFVTTPVGLLFFAALAAAVPSARALRIDPATALRED